MDAARFDAIARALAARVPRRTVLRALVAGMLSSTATIRPAGAQREFDFKPLLLPFPAGPGYLKNGGPDANRHYGLDTNAVDVCRCADNTWGSVGDPVLAPTDLTWTFTDVSRNNLTSDALDFHFFEVASSSGKRLCMSFAHFALAKAPETRSGKGFYPQGSKIGTLLDYRDGSGSIPHIHMGLHTVPVGNTCGGGGRVSVAFEGDYALDGVSYEAGQRYTGPIVSHNGASAAKPSGIWTSIDLNGDMLALRARAYPTNSGDPVVEQVEFTLWWPEIGPRQGEWTVACEETAPSNGDTYSCAVNLSDLGVPLGDIDVSFDVYDVAGNYQLAPNGVRTVEYSSTEDNDGCPAGETRCGNACVYTDSDWWHCGDCNQICGIVQICCGGQCGCDPTVIVPFWCAFAEYTCPKPSGGSW